MSAESSDWRQRATNLHADGRAVVGGRRVAATSGETFDCLSPIDGRTLAQIARCRGEDVDAADRKSVV